MGVLQVSEQFNIFEYLYLFLFFLKKFFEYSLSIPHIDGYIRDTTTCFEYDVFSR